MKYQSHNIAKCKGGLYTTTNQNVVRSPLQQNFFRKFREGNSWTLVTTILPFPQVYSMITSDDSSEPTHTPSWAGNDPSHSMFPASYSSTIVVAAELPEKVILLGWQSCR